MYRILIVFAVTTLVSLACDGDGSVVATGDLSEAGTLDDGPPADGISDTVPDRATDMIQDGLVTGPDLKFGELVGGSGILKGGAYELQAQVGHWSPPQKLSGGGYSLEWNAPVLSW